jgi:hypothetical protein
MQYQPANLSVHFPETGLAAVRAVLRLDSKSV